MSKLINKEALKQSLIKVKQYIDDRLFGNSESLKDIISEEITKGLSTIVDSAPEAFDTLKEVADWIAQDETHSAGIIESINKNTQSINEIKNTKADSTLSTTSENPVMNKVITEELNKLTETVGEGIPIGKGEADNSAVLKGEYEGYSNKAISQTSMAIGAATTAGLKGWYYSAIDFANKTITLSDKPTYILVGSILLNGGWSSGKPNIKRDDVISLVNNSKYDFCSKVTTINDNVITVDSLPFTELVKDNGASVAVLAGQFSDGYSVYIPERPDAGLIDFGGGAFSEGSLSKATNIASHAEGLQTHAYGQYSHTEGRETKAGYIAHAEGSKSEAIGNASHAEGTENIAANSNSHAEGRYTKATGYAAHAEGYGESLVNPNLAQGNYSHVEGEKTKTLGIASHAEGGSSVAKGNFSHSEGRFTRAHALCSHAEGFSVEGKEDEYGAFGPISHVEGYANTTTSTANSAHAEGRLNVAKGMGAHVEGVANVASGEAAHAEGCCTEASGKGSHAEGGLSGAINAVVTASGDYSHAEGSFTIASGRCSHAEGNSTSAIGSNSHAEGFGTKTTNTAEHASGQYNASTKSSSKSAATQFSIGIGTSEDDRKNAFEVKQNGDIYIEGVEGKIQDKLNQYIGSSSPMVSVTYAELVNLSDNGELVAGMQYRITDYVTTTIQENTQSAGHAFDVIVMATDERTLSEEARAIVHDGDTYFTEAGANLAAWKVWYCLDNDSERFAWAKTSLYSPITKQKMIIVTDRVESYIYIRDSSYDSDGKCAWLYEVDACNLSFIEYIKLNNESLDTSDIIYTDSEELEVGTELDMANVPVWLVDISWATGNGVIYRLIDEWNNDCPYDFKNIQFKRNLNLTDGLAEFSENGEETWVYTFAGQSYHINNDECSDMLDGSLESPFGHMSDEGTSTFHDNVIKPYIKLIDWETEDRTKVGVRYLNGIVFLGYWEKIGSANEEDAPYYYAYCCHSNSLGHDCHSNSFGNGCQYNCFGNDCYSNSFGNDCHSNSFGNNCYHNSFSYGCNNNSFGNECLDNSFGKGCVSNSFGNCCYSNSVGEDISYATLLSGVTEIEGIGQSHAMVARNSAGVVKIFNIADLVE